MKGQTQTFSDLGLETRLLQAIAKANFSCPTPIQAKSIPLALEGRDILARSKTGSGKTAAYILPILQSVLQRKIGDKRTKATIALILVPTRELAQQVSRVTSTFSAFCSKDIKCVNLTQKVPEAVQRTLLAESPDIVVATPARAAENIQNSSLSVDKLLYLVIDEADLVLSYGYDDDLHTIATSTPKGVQTFLMSATLSTEVNILKGLFCRDPVILDIKDDSGSEGGVSQYIVECAEDEKFLLAYVIFKLKLIKGKCILFVADIDRCYRLKLFLEQFGIKSCVLNSELPVNSRVHVVEEFNKNVYEIIIASDEHEVLESHAVEPSAAVEDSEQRPEAPNATDTIEDAMHLSSSLVDIVEHENGASENRLGKTDPPRKQKKKPRRSKEYGISRGIDFQNVACVLNFDLPISSKSYTHRIGRTARAGKTGMALSFVVPEKHYHKHKSSTISSAKHDEEVLDKIIKQQQEKGNEVKPYHFDMKQVDPFRYRMSDALRAVTRIAIREARTRELRQELLKSEKLKRHFEENPEDLHHLRHDGENRAARIQPHLKHVPEYLMPSNGKKGIVGEDIGFVGLRKTTDNRIRRARMQNRMKGKVKKPVGRTSDPLKTFNAKGRR
ncbi:ATP-dependent RNA helicase DDX56/DBP9, partial [Lecanoromycetidae sp. Uapishka_2]